MFQKYPHKSLYRYKKYTEKGKPVDAKIPLHMGNGDFSIIGAWADHAQLSKQLIADEGKYPGSADFVPLRVKDTKGKINGYYFVWLAKYLEMDLGPYEEAVFCMAVTPKSNDKVFECVDDEVCGVHIFQEFETYCHLLYLNSDLPIAYGNEILGTNKHKMQSKVTFTDLEGGSDIKKVYDFKNILKSDLTATINPLKNLGLLPRIAGQYGYKNTFRALWDSINDHEVNKVVRFSRGQTTMIDSEKFFTSCTVSIKLKEQFTEIWNPERHQIEIYDKTVKAFNLRPQLLFNIRNAKGIFHPPHNLGDRSSTLA
mmetsp:Transcript_3931/g.3347  ORF Transcript_3931/g.3347 Transcript_3931/m.3347 type:complete len:312 (-) Transcript_3931:37-972(-)